MPSGSPSGPPILKPVFGIFAVLGWVLLIGLHVVWHYTFGWLFTTLADFIEGIGFDHFGVHFHPFHDVAAWLRSLDRNVDSALVTAANKLEHSAVWLFSRVGSVFGWLASRVEELALGVEHAVRKLIAVTIPRLVGRLLRLVWKELRSLGKFARAELAKARRSFAQLWKFARHAYAWTVGRLGKLGRYTVGRFKKAWGEIVSLEKQLTKLYHAFYGKRFYAFVRKALDVLGLGFLNTHAVRVFMGWFSRLSLGELYEFVKDAWIITTTTDLCKLAAYQFDLAVYVFEPVMQELIGLSNWICRHKGHTLPSATDDTPGYTAAWAPSATPAINGPWDPGRLAPNLPLPRGVVKA